MLFIISLFQLWVRKACLFKGQLISECPFDVLNCPKTFNYYFRIFDKRGHVVLMYSKLPQQPNPLIGYGFADHYWH